MPEVNYNKNEKRNITKNRKEKWFEVFFSASLFLFWIKGSLSVNYRSIRVNEPNLVFFGLIPAGQSVQNIPINNVSGVTINSEYNISRFIMGIILVLIGLSTMQQGVWGIIILALGIVEFLNGIITTLRIEKSGSSFDLQVPFYDKSRMQEAAQTINQALGTHEDKSDLSLYKNRLDENEMDSVDGTKNMNSNKSIPKENSMNNSVPKNHNQKENTTEQLVKYKKLLDDKVITEEEFKAIKKRLLEL